MQAGDVGASSVEVALLRAILETAAHDLGSLSSALAMHAQALELGAKGEGLAPVQGVGAEIRTLGRQLRELRGPMGGASLAPTRAGLLSNWMARTVRFGRAHLPRGTALESELSDDTLSVSDASAHALTFAVFALLRDLREAIENAAPDISVTGSVTRPRRRVQISVAPVAKDVLVTIAHYLNGDRVPIARSDSPWWTFALSRATQHSIAVSLRDGVVQMMVPHSAV